MPPLAQLPTHRHFTSLMPPVSDPDFAQLRPGLWLWHTYDPTVKTELFSSAIATPSGIFLVDPIPLPDRHLATLTEAGPVTGIIVTNANHQRAAFDYSDRFSVPVLGHPETLAAIKPTRVGDLAEAGLDRIDIPGAVTGEIALYQPSNGGTLIVGDALINLEGYGFTFLPAKYCLDQKQMRQSLRKLLPLPVERLLFAHGTPVITQARERLIALIKPA